MTGFLYIPRSEEFMGERSVSWLRSHRHETPHRKLYDRFLFNPVELRAFVEKHTPRGKAS